MFQTGPALTIAPSVFHNQAGPSEIARSMDFSWLGLLRRKRQPAALSAQERHRIFLEELTPAEKHRIYLEEKARLDSQCSHLRPLRWLLPGSAVAALIMAIAAYVRLVPTSSPPPAPDPIAVQNPAASVPEAAAAQKQLAPSRQPSTKCVACERDADGRIKRSEAAVHEFRSTHPCPSTGNTSGACPGYAVDHIVPLYQGGADTPTNMQWLTVNAHKAKHSHGTAATASLPSLNYSGVSAAWVEDRRSYGSDADAPIYTGPRGGRYHYSQSGKKVYEPRRR